MSEILQAAPERIVSATRRNPLRTYQFRVGIVPAPADSQAREFLTGTEAGAQTFSSPERPTGHEAGPGDYVAGVKKVSGLNMSVSAHEVREGGNALHRYANPDKATWDAITLEQGLALDDTLERWADAVVTFLKTGKVDPNAPVKRHIVLDVWDPSIPSAGEVRPVRRYLIFNAWVSRFQAIPQLDAMTNEVALLTVELTHEGWRLDSPPHFATPDAFSTPL